MTLPSPCAAPLIHEDRAVLYAGCGIVRGSDPEREWREAGLKMEAVRGALAAHSDDNGVSDESDSSLGD